MRVSRIIVITFALSGLVACGGDDGARTGTPSRTSTPSTAPTSATPTSAPLDADAILIEERITDARLHIGVVLNTSVLGEAKFCPGGKSTGGSEGATITETFQCPGGTLTVRFAPTQRSLVQGAPWEVVSGTGSFEGLRGGGSMVARFTDEDPDSGLVTFVGTVAR
jgi:hypothetical protein